MFDYLKKWITIYVLLAMMAVVACKKDNDRGPLMAAIGGDPVEVLAGDSVTFSDLSQGQASRWKWTFEGGTPATSDLSSPTVVYTKVGKYKVTLEIGNASQTSTVTKEDFVTVGYNEIKVDFEADQLVALQGDTIHFTDHTTGIPESWSWEFIHETQGVLYTSTEQNPVMAFDVPGKYTVKLKAANPGFSGEKIIDKYIEIIDRTYVLADFTATQTATYAGGAIHFQDASLGNVESRTWTFEGGNPATSTDAKPTVTYAAPGRYKVKLTASNSSRSSDKEMEKYILVVPGDGLAAFLPFNNAVENVGPLAMDVSLEGSAGFANKDRNDVTGNCMTFDGATGVLLLSEGKLNLGTGDFTIACWVKASSTARMMLWQESGKNGGKDNQSWLRMGDNTTDRQLRFDTEESSGSSIMNMGNEGKLNNNNWNQVVCVRQAATMSVYINGAKVKDLSTASARNVTGAQNFKIGFQEGTGGFSNYFTGSMDDFLIYKKALTPAEITTLYNL